MLPAPRYRGQNSLEIVDAAKTSVIEGNSSEIARIAAALPLALGGGTGSHLRQPLGIIIVGGLLLSQVVTLLTTPVIYLWFGRARARHSPARPSGAGGLLAGACLAAIANRQGILLGLDRVQPPFRTAQADADDPYRLKFCPPTGDGMRS